MANSRDLTPEEWNEPVWYCRTCHSLCVLMAENFASPDWDGSYCGRCSSTDIAEEPFGKWLEEEEEMERKRDAAEWRRL